MRASDIESELRGTSQDLIELKGSLFGDQCDGGGLVAPLHQRGCFHSQALGVGVKAMRFCASGLEVVPSM
ncbi:MAG: hypothetical protein QOF68_381 [Gaiellales bacterium]|nr:hypothetical protein [Gaiellales bacterium]